MIAHPIERGPIAVVGVEFGRVLVRERSHLQIFGGTRTRPERSKRVYRPFRALAPNRLLQRRVRIIEIGIDEFDRLVEHLMRRGAVGIESGLRSRSILSADQRYGVFPIATHRDPA